MSAERKNGQFQWELQPDGMEQAYWELPSTFNISLLMTIVERQGNRPDSGIMYEQKNGTLSPLFPPNALTTLTELNSYERESVLLNIARHMYQASQIVVRRPSVYWETFQRSA